MQYQEFWNRCICSDRSEKIVNENLFVPHRNQSPIKTSEIKGHWAHRDAPRKWRSPVSIQISVRRSTTSDVKLAVIWCSVLSHPPKFVHCFFVCFVLQWKSLSCVTLSHCSLLFFFTSARVDSRPQHNYSNPLNGIFDLFERVDKSSVQFPLEDLSYSISICRFEFEWTFL